MAKLKRCGRKHSLRTSSLFLAHIPLAKARHVAKLHLWDQEIPPPVVGGAAKLHQEGNEVGAIRPSSTPVTCLDPTGGDGLEDRGWVLFTAFVDYTVPSSRSYQGMCTIESLPGSWK